ncbi:hypothetical protein [Staphylococcus ureilyticus]|uniref:hypothetical protein n=1 Tax=Staphylococcus ureilyticus TaxID=94138 RepID=UPI00292F569E|nr:hypothetical protein [Staphylococcus ureilyticus]
MFRKKIFVIGPSFTDDQIKELFKNGYVYDFNNIEQVYRLQNFLKDKKIGLRIQLEKSELEYKNNNLISRFGVDIKSSKWDEFSEFLRNFNIKITRVHIHNGEKDVNELRKIVSTINTIMEKNVLSNDVDINIGGGWEHIFKNMLLDQTISELEKINGIRSIYIEPGKALIDSIGYLIASVINKYYDVNHLNLILNASAHNLITWFPTYPIASSKSNNNNILTNIWGNTCYEEDFFVKRIAINELDINDKIIFHPFGAYYKNNSKNLHDINFPREVYFQNGVFT